MSKAVFVADARRTNLIILDTCFVEQYMPKLSNGAVTLYVAMCYCARVTGRVFPKVSTLADHCGSSEQSIRNWAKELEGLGLISIDTQFRQNGSQSTNLYTINEISHILTPLPPGNNTPVDTESPSKEGRKSKNAVSQKTEKTTQTEVADLSEILKCLEQANRDQYGTTQKFPLDGRAIGYLGPILRSHGKTAMMDAAVGWRKDSWAVEKRLSYPVHVFKFVEKYAPLAKKSNQDKRYKKLTDTLGGSFPEEWS